MKKSIKVYVVSALAIAVVVLAHLASLDKYPPPSCDEAIYASNSDAWLNQGVFGMTILTAGDPFGRDQNMVHMGRSYAVGQALLFRLLGLDWKIARLYSFLGWSAAVFLTYVVGMRTFGKWVGLAASVAFGTSIKAFLSSHTARPEMWTTTFLLVALFSYILMLDNPRNFPVALFAGIMAVVPLDFHGNGLWFLIAYCTVALAQVGVARRDFISLAGYACGVLVAGAILIMVHLLPEPETSWHQLTTGYRALGNLPMARGLVSNLFTLPLWLRKTFWTAGGPLAVLELGLAVFGVVAALRRRTQYDWMFVTVLLVSSFAFGILMRQRFIQYGVLWSPLHYILGFAAVREWASRGKLPIPSRFRSIDLSIAMCTALVLLHVCGDLWLSVRFRGGNYTEMLEDVASLVPVGSRVLADPIWWWSLRQDRVFLSDEYVVTAAAASRIKDGSSSDLHGVVQRLMDDLRPDYVLLDDAISCWDRAEENWEALSMYVDDNCAPAGRVEGPWVGTLGRNNSQLAQTTQAYYCASYTDS